MQTVLEEHHRCMLIGVFVRHLLKVFKDISSKSPFTPFFQALAPYVIFENSICQFLVVVTRSGSLIVIPQ